MKLDEYNKLVIKVCEDYLKTHNSDITSDNNTTDDVRTVIDFLFSRTPKVFISSNEALDLIHRLPKDITDKLAFEGVYLYYLTKNRYEEIDEETQSLINNVEASLS